VGDLLHNQAESASHDLQPGVDVASFQGLPRHWTHVAGDITWAAVKITELEQDGTRYVNPYADADWKWLHAHAKGRVAYFFGHPSRSPAESVAFFIAHLTRLGLQDADAVAVDLEVTDGRGVAEGASWGVQVLSELERTLSRKPLLYTFVDFARAGYCAGQEDYPLWVADWSTPPGHPEVPRPWRTWAIHQYDISGSIDRDVANYHSLQDMFAALGKRAAKEPDVQNLGGKLVSALTSGRWPNGSLLVAGLGHDGFIQANIWDGSDWSGWTPVSPTRATAGPSVTLWVNGNGRLFYVDEANDVIELVTSDGGRNWT